MKAVYKLMVFGVLSLIGFYLYKSISNNEVSSGSCQEGNSSRDYGIWYNTRLRNNKR